eukprot:m.6387 g.6387  ORF g.6387 m.6387 type:complete len:579 (+) comp15715_c0_seq2:38-1774(+)
MATNSIVSLRRGHHVDLPSHQRRLRHLKSISARNISATESKCILVDSYYTLHHTTGTKELYRSEVIYQSTNPNWAGIDPLNSITDQKCTASPAFVVRVWARPERESDYKVVADWTVDLGALVYIGIKIGADDNKERYPPNSVIFGMFEGYYIAPPEQQSKLSREALEASLILKTISVDRGLIRKTYSTWSLTELQRLQMTLNGMRDKGQQLQVGMATKWNQFRERIVKKKECEIVKTRLRILKDQAKRLAICLRSENKGLEKAKDTVKSNRDLLQMKLSELADLHTGLDKEKQAYRVAREKLRELRRRLRYRQVSLLCQLRQIFPINEASDNHAILNIQLPSAEKYSGFEDNKVGAALGYVVQLISMVSSILGIRLRYRVVMNGSLSAIRDHIRSDFEAADQELNLYGRTKNREKFKYGIFLLNVNIFQLCSLSCELKKLQFDLTNTLPNLHSLFQEFAKQRAVYRKSPTRETPPPAYRETPPMQSVLPPPYEAVPENQAKLINASSQEDAQNGTGDGQFISTMTKTSPSLVRGSTRLASAGFGAAAVAKTLRPGLGKTQRALNHSKTVEDKKKKLES